MKLCTKCKQIKDRAEFSKRRASRDGLFYWCKNCWREYNRKYYRKHRKKMLHQKAVYYRKHKNEITEYNKEWIKNNPERWNEISAKTHAKRKRSLEWELLYLNPFNKCEEVERHHITNKYVVYLPRDLHRLGGEYSGRNTEAHRINLSYIVQQIYGDIQCLL